MGSGEWVIASDLVSCLTLPFQIIDSGYCIFVGELHAVGCTLISTLGIRLGVNRKNVRYM